MIGPSAAGFIFDINHSYLLPILASVAANVIAAFVAWSVSKRGRGDQRPSEQPARLMMSSTRRGVAGVSTALPWRVAALRA